MSQRSSDPFAPRRPPTQRRAQVLVESVREAAKQILEEEGPEGLTTNRVADRAGVSVGSLYHYYPNKESIVSDLFEERVAKVAADIDRMGGDVPLQELPIEDALRRYVEMILEHRKQLAGLHREFLEQWGTRFEVPRRTAPDGRTYLDITRDWLKVLIEKNRDVLDVPNVEVAAKLLIVLTDGFARAASEERLPDIPEDELVAALTRSMLGCLNHRAGTRLA